VEITATGGVRLGWFNASWPFATLRATASRLSLSCGFFGSFEFSAEEVVRLEPMRTFFGLGGGVRIVHAREEYPNKVVFWSFGGPDSLVRRIGAAGFRPSPGGAQLAAAARIGARDSSPVRLSFLLGFLGAWNALILFDWRVQPDRHAPGPSFLLAVALLLVLSFGLTRSRRIRDWVLKPGRSAAEILPLVRLAQLISGILVAVLAVELLFAPG